MARFDPTVAALSGLGLGAGFIYFFDPVSGGRRRKMVADQVFSAAKQLDGAVSRTGRDTAHRLHGAIHEAGRRFRHEGPVDDRVLEERVRARLGRHTSHLSAIEVSAAGGVVTLRGPILLSELDRVLRAADRVPGVDAVVSELEPHETAPGQPWEAAQDKWTPSPRLLAGTLGSGLAVYGAQRRDVVGVVAAAAGLGLLLRAVGNQEPREPALEEVQETRE
jgi:BON domain-containing protein